MIIGIDFLYNPADQPHPGVDVTDYVKFFRETSPYINMHRGKTFVIALSGDGIADANFPHIVQDIALLNILGIRIVLVHGARPQIEQRLAQANIPARFNQHTRITDERTMDCVRDAFGHTRIVIEALLSTGLANSPMHGARIRVVSGNFITAKPVGVRNGIDYDHTGEVRKIDRAGIQRQLDDGAIVLLSSIGYSTTGESFNLTYEDAATHAAVALKAEKLLVFIETPGITDQENQLIRSIDLADIRPHLERTAELPSRQRALLACLHACQNGVPRCHLISYQLDGALLGELFTREGSGTLILHDGSEIIRGASIDDIPGLLDLIAPLEEGGTLVKRSRELLETEISRFTVAIHPEGMIVACAALYPFPDQGAGELACLATRPDFCNRGLASRLLDVVEKQARELHLHQLFVLTTRTAHWFLEKGFAAATLADIPEEKQKLYNYQRNSKIFVKQV